MVATITPTDFSPRDDAIKSAKVYKWAMTATGDEGAPVRWMPGTDRTVQVFGGFGSGGHVLWEGSLQEVPTTYFPLTDPQGNALDLSAAGGEAISEMAVWIRPRMSAGTGAFTVTALLLMARSGKS